MNSRPTKYKTIKHYHEPGNFHELTFSCYLGIPLLANDAWCRMLSTAIARAFERLAFHLHAFVFMPEHVHLLAYPVAEPRVDGLLRAIKRPYSYRIKQRLIESNSSLLDRLTVEERSGKHEFRFWQQGPGYDRNLETPDAVLASIDYIHNNPVRRGLCPTSDGWKWSSASFYASDGRDVDPDLPKISRLPAEFPAGEG